MNYPLKTYVKHGIYFTLYGLVKYLPPPVGDLLRYLVLKLFCANIQSMWIKDGLTIWFPEGVSIGKHCSINEYCFIDGYGEVKIGNNVRIAHRASIISEDHSYKARDILIKDQPKVKGMVIIKDDVWIGCNVTILKHVTIGQGAVIGAGSVIRENVPDYAIVAGNPQKVVGYRKS